MKSEGLTGFNEKVHSYFASFNLYVQMAHFVGKELHIRPSEILDTWGVPELIVAYGEYANEIAYSNYMQYHYTNSEDKPPVPKKYAVRFISAKELEEDNG